MSRPSRPVRLLMMSGAMGIGLLIPGHAVAAQVETPEMSVSTEPSTFDYHGTASDGRTYVYASGDDGDHIEISNVGAGVLEWSITTSSTGCESPTEVPWVATNASSGSVPAGGTSGEVFLDWHGTADVELPLGVHEVLFCVTSNDPQNPVVTVPLTLTIVEPHELPIEGVYIGTDEALPKPYPVPLGGTVPFRAYAELIDGTAHDVAGDAVWTSSNETVATVAAGRVTGVAEGESTITVEYAGWQDSVDVYVHAADATPHIVVDPEALEFELTHAERSADLGLTLTNTGDIHLRWSTFTSTTGCQDDAGEHVDWIRIIVGASLAPDSSWELSDVNNQVDASGLATGEHQGFICIESNDPDRPMVEVPVTLRVTDDGGTDDGGAEDGGAEDGGAENGADDGGTDGGTDDGGAENGGEESGGDGDGAELPDTGLTLMPAALAAIALFAAGASLVVCQRRRMVA